MTYDGKRKRVTTPVGGFFTGLIYFLMFLMFLKMCHDHLFSRNVSSIRGLAYIPLIEGDGEGAMTLNPINFEDSMNVVISLQGRSAGESFDWFNNQYIIP